MYDVVYFSNKSGNTRRFVEKLPKTWHALRIPLLSDEPPLLVQREFVLFVPTYGGGNDGYTVPRQVIKFLNVEQNRALLRGVVGFGNTNFGEHFCRAADVVSSKTGAPVLARVEIFGTIDDVERVTGRLQELWNKSTATTN